jgi:surface protein
MMFAVDVCALPTTGGATGVAVVALFLLVLGVVVAHWVRASSGQVSVVVAPLLLLGALVSAPSVADSCTTTTAPSVTTIAPTVTTPPTTLAPLSPNLVLEIDTTLSPAVGPASLSSLVAGFVYELGLFGDVNVDIDWGDGSRDDDVEDAGPFAHTYVTSGQYTITVSGTLTGFGQEFGAQNVLRGAEYLTAVHSFGDIGIENLSNAFWGANNLIKVPRSLPATVTSMKAMFSGASKFDQPIGGWKTGEVLDMRFMFSGASKFDQPIGDWDTGKVINMGGMFRAATSFDQPIGGWNTSSVEDMSSMFSGASKFDRPIGGWDTSNVTFMKAMFLNARLFNQDLSLWHTDDVTSMEYMFGGAAKFDRPIGGWKTGSVVSMGLMFSGATTFNQEIGDWDTGDVTTMEYMFAGAAKFDRPIGDWDTGNVVDMSGMFAGAAKFDRPIGDWDTSKVLNMSYMFYGASSFNQSLGSWNIDFVSNMANMLVNSALSVANYNATLIGWEDGPKQRDVVLGATGLSFSSLGSNARQLLICMASWQISGDILLQEITPSANDQIVAAGC